MNKIKKACQYWRYEIVDDTPIVALFIFIMLCLIIGLIMLMIKDITLIGILIGFAIITIGIAVFFLAKIIWRFSEKE